MPIRPRGDAWQVDVAFVGKRLQRQAPNEIEAQKLHDQLLQKLKDEAEADPKRRKAWNLGQAIDATVDDIWAHGRSLKMNVINMKLARKFFGTDTALERITGDRIQEWTNKLRKDGNSNGTINRKLACLSKVLSHAKKRGRLDAKPEMEFQKEGLGRIRWITEDEETAMLGLLSQWGKADHHDLCVTGIDTGMRPGASELLNITARDIDLRTNMVAVWTNKTDLPRSIPMTARVKLVLQRRAKVHPTGPLFPYDKEWLRHTWDRMKTVMGLQDDTQFIPYAMRHTFASRLVQRGAPIIVVQQLMGHKGIQMTMRYAHLAPHNLSGAMALLEPVAVAQKTA